MTAQLDGALAGMGERSLPLVRAVTAYDHSVQGTILLGVGCAGYDERAEQTESLFNSHDLRKNGVVVDDITKRDGGEQRLTFDGIHVDLDFVDQKTLSFKLRRPTTSELDELTIHWLSPRRLDLNSSTGNAVRRSPAAIVPSPAPWEKRLGNSPEMITVKTLEAMTQLCESPVEMDKRESPRQHRKQRLQALHPKQIEGRTDSDTFFASIKPVRNHLCIQIFYSVLHRFIFVRGMRKESESHGAYQDLVREVGAPNILLTDNAQTQVGKTSRDNATRQIKMVPHNQNQNNAERKIQDVKRRTILTLRYGKAPLVFWCFCMIFIVDCLNHSAQKELGYQTSMEKMYGHTPDISMFRFHFWEPVWYYEPTAKYPKSNFLPGRFVGIAWDHGDAFTYKIWTTPDDNWKKGQELIQNVVKLRSCDKTEARADYDESSLLLLTQNKTTKNQRRRSQRNSTKRKDRDEPDPDKQEARKCLVTFFNSPQIHDEDPEEKGGEEQEQGTTPKPPTQNNSTSKAPSSTINSKRKQDDDTTIRRRNPSTILTRS
jgi:hypothetical protein